MSNDHGFSDFFYDSADGLKLHARIYGEQFGEPLPVVCLPGLTRNARDFHELALYLANRAKIRRKIVAFDYRGRGGSARDANGANYNIAMEAGDVLTGLDVLGIAAAAFIGTSRGGLIIHLLGALRPSVLKAIVFNDIGPVVETAGLAHIRSYLDRAPTPKTRTEAVDAQRAAHGCDFPALDETDWTRMVEAIHREEKGWLVPDFDPKLAEAVADMDLSQPLPTLWPQFEALAGIPMLAIRGANSRLLSAATLDAMRKRHPRVSAITVAGQGHAPFLETAGLPASIASFIEEAERQANGKG